MKIDVPVDPKQISKAARDEIKALKKEIVRLKKKGMDFIEIIKSQENMLNETRREMNRMEVVYSAMQSIYIHFELLRIEKDDHQHRKGGLG